MNTQSEQHHHMLVLPTQFWFLLLTCCLLPTLVRIMVETHPPALTGTEQTDDAPKQTETEQLVDQASEGNSEPMDTSNDVATRNYFEALKPTAKALEKAVGGHAAGKFFFFFFQNFDFRMCHGSVGWESGCGALRARVDSGVGPPLNSCHRP